MAGRSSTAHGDCETRTLEIGRELLAALRDHARSPLWTDSLMTWALKDERFKTELFRFVDVFPALKTPDQIHRHLLEYLQQPGLTPPAFLDVALKAGGLLKGTLARTVAAQIHTLAETFIAGDSLEAALPGLQSQWMGNVAFSVDLLGEAVVSHPEAAACRARYEHLIEQLPVLTAAWPARPVLETDHLGPVPRGNVSIKISSLDGHISLVDAEGSLDRLTGALAPILQHAARTNVLINFDMEQQAFKELTVRLFKRCCQRWDFPAGLALQTYLRSADDDAQDLVDWSRAQGRMVTVRLIKGAYWDFETIHARLLGWPNPVWTQKRQTDACFERVAAILIARTPRESGAGGVRLALGTHNVRSVAHAMAHLEAAHLPPSALEFQCLRGMAEGLQSALVQRGWRVRQYVPIGAMIPGMAYLVRRLLENTSNQGWLRVGQAGPVSDDQLLAAPRAEPLPPTPADPAPSSPPAPAFQNEPPRDFSQLAVRDAFRRALARATVAPVPSDGTPADADRAIDRASAAFPAWRDTPAERRAAILRGAAAELQRQRDTLSAEIILEAHKTWADADGEVCEAIDFCRFYADQAEALMAPQPLSALAGEEDHLLHEPRGVAAIIAPWNFPLSIPTGMTAAALVTGNTAILKPAEQAPAIARRLCEILWSAGVPRQVLHFLPGAGETVGRALIGDFRIATIAFTGSAAVGLEILKSAHARTPPAGAAPAAFCIPRVIAEMGGKNAIIVDESADLDEAVPGVRQSAFSYAGQKCSACSRVIVLASVHDTFVARLVASTEALILGDPADPATDLGPVIDAQAAARIRQCIAQAGQKATRVFPRHPGSDRAGNLIAPHIFTEVDSTQPLAQEEIFGPVLAILRARDFSHALELANATPYQLTGGIYSRTPSHLARARGEFRVGNLYLNRPITGALVGRQPFGGHGLSGTGPKAGSPEYLLPFTNPRAVTENTLRHGFAPE